MTSLGETVLPPLLRSCEDEEEIIKIIESLENGFDINTKSFTGETPSVKLQNTACFLM